MGAAAVIIAPIAIPPPTTEPTAAIPDEIAAPPAVPEAPANAAIDAPVVPAVVDIIVAAEAPTTEDAVTPAVAAVAVAPTPATTLDGFILSDILSPWIFDFLILPFLGEQNPQ